MFEVILERRAKHFDFVMNKEEKVEVAGFFYRG